jgi:hypothetical protein
MKYSLFEKIRFVTLMIQFISDCPKSPNRRFQRKDPHGVDPQLIANLFGELASGPQRFRI